MKKNISTDYYSNIINKEFPEKRFKYYKDYVCNECIYVFFFYHKLIYPLAHDLHWNVLDRGPLVFDKVNLKNYKLLNYSDFMSDHFEKIKDSFDEEFIYIESFDFSDKQYEFVVDVIKERRYIDVSDIKPIGVFNRLDLSKIRFNSPDFDEKKPYTTDNELVLYLYDQFSLDCYVKLVDDVGLNYKVERGEHIILIVDRYYSPALG